MDAKIEREVWGGQVPAMFTLAETEVVTIAAPLPLFMLLPRVSYVHVVRGADVGRGWCCVVVRVKCLGWECVCVCVWCV
jgi:hypothetical protein